MSYQSDGKTVTLAITVQDFDRLLYALGIATGSAESALTVNWIALTNKINTGNPNWRPYAVLSQTTAMPEALELAGKDIQAQALVLLERERCAKIAEGDPNKWAGESIAAKIRGTDSG